MRGDNSTFPIVSILNALDFEKRQTKNNLTDTLKGKFLMKKYSFIRIFGFAKKRNSKRKNLFDSHKNTFTEEREDQRNLLRASGRSGH